METWTKEQAQEARDLRKKLAQLEGQIDVLKAEYKEVKGPARAKITRQLTPRATSAKRIRERLKELPPPSMSEEEAICQVQKDLVRFCEEYEDLKAKFVERAIRNPTSAIGWDGKKVIIFQKQQELLARAIYKWDGSFRSLKDALEEMQGDARQQISYYDPTSSSTCMFHRAVEAAEYLAHMGVAGERPGSFHLRYLLGYRLKDYAERVQVWQVLQEEEEDSDISTAD